MDIVILCNFCGKLTTTDNDRFSYLASKLARYGDVELIASDFSHLDKAPRRLENSDRLYKITLLHEPGYPKNVCVSRFASHRAWGKNVAKYLAQRKKPDVIYCAVPSITAPLAAAKYCRENGVRFVIDVQDLWPEAFQMVMPIPLVGKILFAPWKYQVDKIYRAADEIVAVSRTYADRALSVNHKCEDAKVVYLGTDLETFDTYAAGDAPFKKEKDKLYLGYCGTLGASYDIPCVLNALELLKNRGAKTPCFVVLGDGPQKETFERMAKERGLDVLFTGRLPYNEMCRYLSACDMLVNPIVKGAAQSIINKHADYAAAGKAVINTQECAEYRELIKDYGCGINCRVGDAGEVAEAIRELAAQEKSRLAMGQNARRMAEEIFDRHKSYAGIAELVERD